MEQLSETLGFGPESAAETAPSRARARVACDTDADRGRGRGAATGAASVPTARGSSIKYIALPLVLTLPMLALVWTIAARPPTASAPTRTAASPALSIYRTSAVQLYRDYNSNEAATQARIGQQSVLVTGKVTAVSQDYLGDNQVLLDVGNSVSAAEMTLRSDQNLLAVQLEKGQQVALLCDQMQRLTDAPEGSGCALVEPERSYASSQATPGQRLATR
jgi:tRNA_anti-like